MRLRLLAALVLPTALNACALLPWGDATPEPVTLASPVDILSAGLLADRDGGAELGLILNNVSERLLWVRVQFATPSGQGGCMTVKELPPGERGAFLCPQSTLTPGIDYPVRVTVFSDPEQSRWEDVINTELRFEQADLQALGQ